MDIFCAKLLSICLVICLYWEHDLTGFECHGNEAVMIAQFI